MIKKVSLLMLISLLTLNISNHAVTLFASSDKQQFIDAIKSFENVLKLKEKGSLLTRNLQTEKVEWNKALDAIKGYVELNANQYLEKFNSLRNLSDQLFNKLSANYATNVSGKTSFDVIAMDKIFNASPRISILSTDAVSAYNDLSKTVIAALPKTKAVRAVLAQLGLTLSNICTKIKNDLLPISQQLLNAIEAGNAEQVQTLISAGANPNLVEKNGETPLQVAVIKGSTAIVTILIKAGAHPFAENKIGLTSFDLTKSIRNSEQQKNMMRILALTGIEGDVECPICLDDKPKTAIVVLPCGHYICRTCLQGLKELKCPICRKSFKKDNIF